MGNEAHRGYGVQGMGTWAIAAQVVWVQGVWATWAIGHMANGAHNGVWAGWILTKILLDIDINGYGAHGY